MNDLALTAQQCQQSNLCRCHDVCIHFTGSPAEVRTEINKATTEFLSWAAKNHVKVNYDKTQAIMFSLRIPIPQVSILAWVVKMYKFRDHATYLGVTFDTKMSFRRHFANIKRRAKFAPLGFRKVLRTRVRPRPFYNAKPLYRNSEINFGTCLRGLDAKLDSKRGRLYGSDTNRALRLVASVPRSTCLAILREDLNLPT